MQEVIYNSKLNLSECFPVHLFQNLIKVFPRLNSIIPKNIISNSQPIFIDKFLFYRMILEKIKISFEVSESFVISESINIILKDIKGNSLENKNKTKTELPLINIRKESNDISNTSMIRSPSNYSNKNKGNSNKSTPKKNTEKKSVLKEKLNNNHGNINQVFISFEGNKISKKKLVHFFDNNYNDYSNNENNKPKVLSKKSNLKPINNKSNKMLNVIITNQNKTMTNNNSNNNIKEPSEKKKLAIKTKTEFYLRAKSSRTKRVKIEEPKEKDESFLPERINNIYEKNLKNFINIDDKNFNIFEFESKVGKENTLLLIGKYIFNYFKFGDIVNQAKYDNWVEKIGKGYIRNNSYHHDLHAADTAHTSYIYLRYGLIHEIAKLDTSMIFAVTMSCICHDYKHPGVNNNYLIETDNDIAINYNDISVLENMHISEAFKLMHTNPNFNVFEGFDKEKYKKIRKQMICCVLSTDMTKHSSAINFLNNYLSKDNIPEDNDKQEYMNLVVHSSDISNPTKRFDIYFKWAKLIVEEFYDQGDKEKKLGLKCSCDRTKVNIYKNQLGFIDFIELPFFSLITKAFPKLDFLLNNLNNNKQKIKQLEEEYNKNNSKI